MQKKLWIILLIFVVAPIFLFTSCQQMQQPPKNGGENGKTEEQMKMEQEYIKAKEIFENDHIYFDFDSSVLSAAAQATLTDKAAFLKKYADKSVTVGGHCDERGTNEYNLALGERRANSAKAFLVDLGVDGGRLDTVSYGEEDALDGGHNEEAWAKNRRDQFAIK